MMTPRENFSAFFRGDPYEWAPTTADVRDFLPSQIPDHVARGLVKQQNPFPEEKYGGKDLFGVEWVYQPKSNGSMEVAPLFEDPEDLLEWRDKVRFPDYEKDIDWEACKKENAEYLNTDKMISTTIYTGFFERLISFVGFEDAAVAFLDEDMSEEVPALFDALVESYLQYIALLKKHFNVGHIFFHDDWGTQKSTMFSTDVYEEFLMPALTKLAKGAHDMGVVVEQHSCGKIEKLIPYLAETGIDTWKGQPVNDKDKLIEEVGDKFKFCVVIAPPFYGDDKVDELLKIHEAALKKYEGKKVWFGLPWALTEAGKDDFRSKAYGK